MTPLGISSLAAVGMIVVGRILVLDYGRRGLQTALALSCVLLAINVWLALRITHDVDRFSTVMALIVVWIGAAISALLGVKYKRRYEE